MEVNDGVDQKMTETHYKSSHMMCYIKVFRSRTIAFNEEMYLVLELNPAYTFKPEPMNPRLLSSSFLTKAFFVF